MFDEFLDENLPERAPIEKVVAYFRARKPDCVRIFIARRLVDGVFRSDVAEVLYWSAVHAEVIRTQIPQEQFSEISASLARVGPSNH